MRLIELHILQSFPVSCLNRDDVGAPKTAVFGGAPRARVSSQCWKRAIRLHASGAAPEFFAGQRGNFMAAPLQAAIRAEGIDEDQAIEASETVMTFLGKQDKKYKGGHKSSVALYLSPGEVEAIAAAAARSLRESGKVEVKRGDLKRVLSQAHPRDMADIAVFGRMVADDHTLSLEGAGLFSHAISTHRVSNEIDFFTAVDDLKLEESEGAGHMGTLEFNSACYYRYAGLNVDLLFDDDHLGHLGTEDRRAVVEIFVRSVVKAVPGARRNSMFANTLPQFVLGLHRDKGQPLSMANAFERPIRSTDGLVATSRKALEEHYDGMNTAYGLEATEYRLPEVPLDDLVAGLVGHVG